MVQGDAAAARAMADRALALDSGNAAAWAWKAIALAELSRPEEALAAAGRAVQLAPASAASFCALGATFLSGRRLEEAAGAFSYATSLVPCCGLTWFYAAACWALLGYVEECRVGLGRAFKLEPRLRVRAPVVDFFSAFRDEPWFAELLGAD